MWDDARWTGRDWTLHMKKPRCLVFFLDRSMYSSSSANSQGTQRKRLGSCAAHEASGWGTAKLLLCLKTLCANVNVGQH